MQCGQTSGDLINDKYPVIGDSLSNSQVLYIRYVQLYSQISKHHLTFIKRPGRHLISLKILISNG